MEKRKQKNRRIILLAAILLAAVLLFAVPYAKRAAENEKEESVQAITETVRKLALQCYVIEGAYPSGLEYLEENYGLTVNKDDFKIVYTSFAENLPPDVKVIVRHE